MFYSLIGKFIRFCTQFTYDKHISQEFTDKNEAQREPTRDIYEDMGRHF